MEKALVGDFSLAALPVTVRVDEGRGAGGLLGAGEVGASPGELHPVLLHGEALLRRVPADLPGTSTLIQYSTVQYSTQYSTSRSVGNININSVIVRGKLS